MHRISLDYHPATRLQFIAQLSSTLSIEITNQEIAYPLEGLELRETGLFVPDQDIHRAYPDFPAAPFIAGDVTLWPLGLRIERTFLNQALSDSTLEASLNPKLDFELQLSSFEKQSPSFALHR